jgi:HlyD family secretion protein
MANSKKRRKTLIFSVIGVVVAALAGMAMFKKRDVMITVQTEKVARRDLTEIVVANGKIQPVTQVKISPEVSGEIIELSVKEGQQVKKGDLLLKIKPDFYIASRNQAEAGYQSSLAGKSTAEATLRKAEAEYKRGIDLFQHKLISESNFDEFRAAYDVAKAQLTSAEDQTQVAKAALDSAEDQLSKTTIVSPLTGTITKLNSELGERVLGTVQNMGTEIMTLSDLNEMEARVDVGETDVVLISPGQNVHLEVDAFKDGKFTGTVTEVANSSGAAGVAAAMASNNNSQEATKFGVKVRIKEKEAFRPGMSCTAEIETRSRTNVLCVPIASVTTRMPKEMGKKNNSNTNSATAGTNVSVASNHTIVAIGGTNSAGTNTWLRSEKKAKENTGPKQVEVVFLKDGDHAKMVSVKHGIGDDMYYEIVSGVDEGQEVISGGYRAISRDLEDGKKIKIGPPVGTDAKKDEETPKQ